MRLLAVETSTPVSSVALADETGLLACRPVPGRLQTEQLMVVIDQLLRDQQWSIDECDFFASAVGPGAFIGLRVGIATVKGLAMATGKPVVPVSSLEALALRPFESLPPGWSGEIMICPMLDAKRGQIYGARYRMAIGDDQGEGMGAFPLFERMGEEQLLSPEEFLSIVGEVSTVSGPVLFLGDGAALHRSIIEETRGSQAQFSVNGATCEKGSGETAGVMLPSATCVARLALGRAAKGIDPAALAPVYFRPAAAAPEVPGR